MTAAGAGDGGDGVATQPTIAVHGKIAASHSGERVMTFFTRAPLLRPTSRLFPPPFGRRPCPSSRWSRRPEGPIRPPPGCHAAASVMRGRVCMLRDVLKVRGTDGGDDRTAGERGRYVPRRDDHAIAL